MEQVQTLFREGVMSHLQQLEALSRNLAVKQEQNRRQGEILQEKRDLILSLERQREELQAKTKLQKEQIQGLKLMAERSAPAGPSTREVLQDMRLEEMESIMEALWFTGISGKKTDHGACFCISTAFEGTYLDSYYLQIDHLEKPKIVKHSVPVFLPLERIAKQHLPAGLSNFLSALCDHLNAYAGRRYQADQLQKQAARAFVSGTLRVNSLCTVLSFSYDADVKGHMTHFSAKLLYADITRTLPTEAQITCSGTAGSYEDAIAAHSALFCSAPLHRALESIGS